MNWLSALPLCADAAEPAGMAELAVGGGAPAAGAPAPVWEADPVAEEVPMLEDEPEALGVAGAAGAGCIAGEPVAVVPEPDAVGRSVAPDGAVPEVWARAGTAAKAVATRQAARCFLSILFS